MKTVKIVSLLSLVLMIGLSGCSDFLDQQPRLSQTNELSLSTFEGMNKAIVGAYSPLYDYTWYGRDFVVSADMRGGNAKASPINSGRFRQAYLWTYTPTTTLETWGTAYNLIARVNNIINALDGFSEVNVTDVELKNLEGEARFLRALAYHDLVRTYAQPYTYDSTGLGVPLVLVTENGKPARAAVNKVYQQIVDDLRFAEQYLSATNSHRGTDAKAWATKRAAQALLARVYLYMGKYQRAADYATAVINQESETFRLFTQEEYSVFNSANNPKGAWGALIGKSEVIFEVYGAETNSSHGNWDVISYVMSPKGYGDVGASNDVISLYDTADVRSKLFVNDPDKYPNDMWSLKFPGKNGNLREDNIPVLRLVEMYLIRAEALLNDATITGATALADINAIRSNRKAPLLTTVAKVDVMTERRLELCYEGHIVYDLARTKTGLTRTDFDGANNKDVSFPNYKWALPIPQQEIDLPGSLCVQNPEYGNN